MEILIKSFNRPYYLDRCLQSIYLHCKGFSAIKILDDGTPQIYLDKIQVQFPDVMILKSEAYVEKSEYCKNGVEPKIKSIPIDFWVESAKKSTDFFLILEDDCWIIEDIDFQEVVKILQSKNCQFLKLFWLGNPKLIQKKKEEKYNKTVVYKPYLHFESKLFFYVIFFKFNRFGIRNFFKFFKIHTFEKLLSFYSIYSVSSIVFRKDYFMNLWENHNNSVNESLQLYNALKYYNKNKSVNFAHSEIEKIKTGFTSSATTQKKNGIEIDMFQFNFILNESWLNNQFDSMQNYPKDFSQIKIDECIQTNKYNLINSKSWKQWSNEFKNQYRNFGCIVE
jgi:hypothetical protein